MHKRAIVHPNIACPPLHTCHCSIGVKRHLATFAELHTPRNSCSMCITRIHCHKLHLAWTERRSGTVKVYISRNKQLTYFLRPTSSAAADAAAVCCTSFDAKPDAMHWTVNFPLRLSHIGVHVAIRFPRSNKISVLNRRKKFNCFV